MIDCKHLSKGNCQIASGLAGKPAKTSVSACAACLNHNKPMQLNNVTASLAISSIERPIPEDKKYLFKSVESVSAVPEKPVVAYRRGQVGTELFKIIPKLFKRSGCDCRSYAKRLDAWGIAGCKQNSELILDHLLKKASEDRVARLFPEGVTKAVANRWLSQAIHRAEKSLKESLPDNGNWFVAVTTAPRTDSELNTTLESVISAGWTPHIVSEPGVDLTNVDLPWTQNKERKGVWYNWLNAARIGLESGAENILTIQDDAEFHPESRLFTESILWPTARTGFVSLYTAKHYSYRWRRKQKFDKSDQRPIGVNRIYTKSFWGAVALVFHRDVLEQMLEHDVVKKWKGCPPKKRKHRKSVYAKRKANPFLVQNSDTAIGRALIQMKRDLMFIDPSPAQHIAKHSSIGHGGNLGRRNCGRCADFEASLFDQIPVKFKPVDIDI